MFKTFVGVAVGIVAISFAAIFIKCCKETITSFQGIGILLIFLAIVIASKKGKKFPHIPPVTALPKNDVC